MPTFLIAAGALATIASLVFLMINLVKQRPVKSPLIALVIAIILCGIGGATMPPSDTPNGDASPARQEVDGAEGAPEEKQGSKADPETASKRGSEEAATPSATAPTGQMKVHFIDVGQGDSILIQTPKQNVLIDGGTRSSGSSVVSYIKGLGVTRLDMVIGTHPHEDHIGGLIAVLQQIPAAEVIDPGVIHTTKTFSDYLDAIEQNENTTFTEGRAGMTRDLGGGAKMQILHPSSPSDSHLNNASVVTRLTFGEISFVLSGDAESAAENQILGRGYMLSSTILKIGHHGSKTATTQKYLDAVKPKAAIIMCGKGNSYGHPHDETLSKLAAAEIDIYRTDDHGTIIVTTNGKTFSVNKQPMAYAQQPQPPPAKKTEAAPASTPKQETKPESKPEPKPEPETPATKGAFVGSAGSDKYHYPTCRYASNILEKNEIWFKDAEEAKAAGYKPCGTCKPPQ